MNSAYEGIYEEADPSKGAPRQEIGMRALMYWMDIRLLSTPSLLEEMTEKLTYKHVPN